jgi:hypothetical protein
MKKILLSMTAALMLMSVFTACSSDDDSNNEQGKLTFTEKTYNAWSKVVFGYGSMFDSDETITIDNEAITFHSDTWGDGTFTVDELTRNTDGSWSVTATGTITMAGHGSSKAYDATVSGSIASSSQTFTIKIPSVMGGTVLNVTAGELPLVAAIDGTYKGGTYANSQYFQHYQPTENEKVTIKANETLDAAELSYTSETWGTFTFEEITVTKNADGSYTLTGEGNTLMPSMRGGTTEYAATFNGSIADKTLVATFSVPGVMGGTTIYFNAEDFDEVLEAANAED